MPTITLANDHFTFGVTTEDNIRRENYFRNPNNPVFSITDEEQRVLTALGIDAVMENSMRPYLAKFFTALPECQTDAQMILSKACEIPYYVIWSTQFGARQSAKAQFDANKKKMPARTDIEMAENSAMIDSLKPVPQANDIVREIFTLISAPAPRNVSVIESQRTLPTRSMIERVFTLIPV